MAMADGYTADLIRSEREGLGQCVITNKDPLPYVQSIINVDVPLAAKFGELNFCDILQRNSASAETLKQLIMGLKILEKYGRHLLKPAESRSNMWQHIKYNNSVFSSRVDNLQGGREIMLLMGYSEVRPDRVAFPDGSEPDHDKVLNLIVDIIVGKKELETYLNGNHPYPHFIEDYLSEDIVLRMKSNSAERAPDQPEQQQMGALDFQPATLPAISLMETISIPQKNVAPTSEYGEDPNVMGSEPVHQLQTPGYPQTNPVFTQIDLGLYQRHATGIPQQGVDHLSQVSMGLSQPTTGYTQSGTERPYDGSGLHQQTPKLTHPGPSHSPGFHQQTPGLTHPGPSNSLGLHQQTTGLTHPGPSHSMQATGLHQQITGLTHAGPSHSMQATGLHQQGPELVQTGQGLTQQTTGLTQPATGFSQQIPTYMQQQNTGLTQPTTGFSRQMPTHMQQQNTGLTQTTTGFSQQMPTHMQQQNTGLTQPATGFSQQGSRLPQQVSPHMQQQNTGGLTPARSELPTQGPGMDMGTNRPSVNIRLKPSEAENKDASVEPETPSIACDICGDNRADVICLQCDSKQLCKDCDIKWHKHPKRQNHKVDTLKPAGNTEDSSFALRSQSTTLQTTPQGLAPQKQWEQQQQHAGQIPTQHMIEVPHGNNDFRTNYGQTYQGMHGTPPQQYYIQSTPYSVQHYGEIREVYVDPATRQRYDIPSLPQGQGYRLHTIHQPSHSQVNFNTIHDPGMAENRHHQFLHSQTSNQPQSHLLSSSQPNFVGQSHMIPSSQSNFPGQGFVPGTLYKPLSSSGVHVPSSSDVLVNTSLSRNQYLHHTVNRTQGLGVGGESGANFRVGQDIPATPSPLTTPSPGTPLVSPISNLSDERNYIVSGASSRSVMSTYSDKTLGKSLAQSMSIMESKLLPKIKMIPDFEKQRSRLDIDLMTLKEDIDEWDKKINEIILNDPNFFHNEEYISLNNKKRKHLHEINELETYQKELVIVIEESTSERKTELGAHKQEIAPPNFHPGMFDQKGSTGHHSDYDMHRENSGQTIKGPERTTYQPVLYSPSKPLEDPVGRKPSNMETGGGDGIPEDVRRMLVLGQSPFDFHIKPKQPDAQPQMNVPFETDPHNVAYPPDVVNNDLNTLVPVQKITPSIPKQNSHNSTSHLTSGKSAPDLQHIQPGKDIARSHSITTGHQWECEHCTYINDATIKACNMCFKTSDNPKILYLTVDDNNTVNEAVEVAQSEADTVNCKECTFLNQIGYTNCEMCGEPPRPGMVKDKSERSLGQPIMKGTGGRSSEPVQDKDDVLVQMYRQDGEAEALAQPKRGLDDIIRNDQDQIYWEKKAAQEQYEKNNKNGNQSGSDSSGPSTVIENVNWVTSKGSIPSKVSSLATNSEETENFETAKTSLNTSEGEQEVTVTEVTDQGAGATQKGFKGSSDFTKAIEQIQLQREKEQMSLDGRELMSFVKSAEKSDFDMEEIMVALQHCQQDEMKPLDWLEVKWKSKISLVEDMAIETGKTTTPNDVGDISQKEAKEALLFCEGNVEEAATKCVVDRQAKYKKITECGHYAREEIVTALFQNHGDVEEALDQLNQSVITAYIDRLWDSDNNLFGRHYHLNGGNPGVYDLNHSVSNSIVNSEAFQDIIKDVTVDRERRTRMVFVEGKLVSWGRADLVISILEQNVIQAEDPLDCTLDDIIDAVRNCGDRKSSLVYLKQECGTCMGLFPMSKIRSLGVCNCQLCESCLKQYFEIAIREKFVRNWGCPLCDAPGLVSDDTNGADYFDFLHLVLERLMPRDVIDLFDTKLRDWHLQKDPNFRWCAHCAFGFIWGNPGNLGMTCESCKKKTCFSCKIKWEEQHKDLTCEEFAQWKIDNDPEKQAKGVKLYLEENGIDCPSCKMRYSLAKGGCMHFKCPQCGHEFCSGCSQPFKQQEVCKELKSCRNKGLHCHHPRDCYYYLRDNDVGDLQKLLKKQQVRYNADIPENQADKEHCPVMEQKEFGALKKDEACGREIQRGNAGLCESHYKEYLVGLINKNKIDPVTALKMKDLKILIERNELVMPAVKQNENEAQYRSRLIQFIKERFRLHR